jgi:quinolinate synthase
LHINEVRARYPKVKVIVHPECREEIVDASDESGSTGNIIKYVENAPAGSVIAIGTEVNLVHRLAQKYKDKKIIQLARSLCPNMYKINLNNLCFTLENIGKVNLIQVPLDIKTDARVALDRMLTI